MGTEAESSEANSKERVLNAVQRGFGGAANFMDMNFGSRRYRFKNSLACCENIWQRGVVGSCRKPLRFAA